MKKILSISAAAALLCLSLVKADYNATKALELVYYSAATFCDESTVEYSWSCGAACKATPGVGAITIVSDFLQGTYGFVLYNNNTNSIVVAFRGSYTYANWYEDADYGFTPYLSGPKGAEVHEGFYNSYQGLSYQVIDAVTAYLKDHPTAELSITGHSLGASYATFAALDIKEKLKPTNKFNIYTYGSPRCGNQNFTDYVFTQFPGAQYSRVVHTSDIVPHLPLTAMGFNHAGEEIWYSTDDDKTKYTTCANKPGEPESELCSDSLYVYDPSAHLDYIGVGIVEQCDTPASFVSTY